MNTLAAQELVKEFGVKRVVDRTSFNVHEGEVVGLLGPNGAGKTTTFYMLVGIHSPDAGQVIYNGDGVYLPSASSKGEPICAFEFNPELE